MEHNDQYNTVHLLWTGGWDSTYRLVELSRTNVNIQTVYCCDPARESSAIEKKHMLQILMALEEHPDTKAHFLPTMFVDVDTIPENREISDAYQMLAADGGLGSQYDWLARLASSYPGLELGIEKANHEKNVGCRATILKHGAFTTNDGVTVLDKEASSRECVLVMGNFRFPIIGITETEMVENINTWGYEGIMQLIWFCHDPIRGKPCGMCSPCRQKMEGAMDFLLPAAAQRRYKLHRFVRSFSGEFGGRVLKKLICTVMNF